MSLPSTLSVVVPAYNERDTLSTVVRKLLTVPYLFEILIVDDCSTDGTYEIAQQLASQHDQVTVLRHDQNRGKTGALKTGIAASRGDILVIQDADLEYDPSEMIDLITPILNGVADVVYGSRFLVKKATRVLYYYHYLANKTITAISNLLTNINLSDVETGYKAFRGDIIRNMRIESNRFGFEIEVTAKIAKLKCAIYEVPISYYGRTYEQGKKIGPMDALAAFWYLIRFNLFCTLKHSFRQLPVLRSAGAEALANR